MLPQATRINKDDRAYVAVVGNCFTPTPPPPPITYMAAQREPVAVARIFKLLRSPGIDSKESIPPAYVAWWSGTITLYQLGT